ncbi:MAG: DNA-3-methyladenine glycosylase [Bacteroidetes bacterium]|nr:DNA-3-methyladenine glycosylase [Bacteroidota bacterium]
MTRLPDSFYQRDVLEVAPELLGKRIVHNISKPQQEYMITEVEAYRGEEDLACHASKGRTKRTEIMYHQGGFVYVYLIYGMYWMMNIVTGDKGNPQAVLIRGVKGISGPGRLGKVLQLDKSYYGEHLVTSPRIWLATADDCPDYRVTPRINIDSAGVPWINKPWRYILNNI